MELGTQPTAWPGRQPEDHRQEANSDDTVENLPETQVTHVSETQLSQLPYNDDDEDVFLGDEQQAEHKGKQREDLQYQAVESQAASSFGTIPSEPPKNPPFQRPVSAEDDSAAGFEYSRFKQPKMHFHIDAKVPIYTSASQDRPPARKDCQDSSQPALGVPPTLPEPTQPPNIALSTHPTAQEPRSSTDRAISEVQAGNNAEAPQGKELLEHIPTPSQVEVNTGGNTVNVPPKSRRRKKKAGNNYSSRHRLQPQAVSAAQQWGVPRSAQPVPHHNPYAGPDVRTDDNADAGLRPEPSRVHLTHEENGQTVDAVPNHRNDRPAKSESRPRSTHGRQPTHPENETEEGFEQHSNNLRVHEHPGNDLPNVHEQEDSEQYVSNHGPEEHSSNFKAAQDHQELRNEEQEHQAPDDFQVQASAEQRRNSNIRPQQQKAHKDPLRQVASTGPSKVSKTRRPQQTPAHQQPLPTSGRIMEILSWTLMQEHQQMARKEAVQTSAREQEHTDLKVSYALVQRDLEEALQKKREFEADAQLHKDKAERFARKFLNLKKHVDGLGNDIRSQGERMDSISENAPRLVRVEAGLQHEYQEHKANAIDAMNRGFVALEAMQSFDADKKNFHGDLQKANYNLQKRVYEQEAFLQETRQQQSDIKLQVQQAILTHESVKQVIDHHCGVMVGQFAMLKTALQNTQCDATVALMEKLADLMKQNKDDADSTEKFKSLGETVEALSENVSTLLTSVNNDTSNTSFAELKEMLTTVKTDLVSCASMQSQITELNSAKVALEQQAIIDTRRISELQDQLDASKKQATVAETKTKELERAAEAFQQSMSCEDPTLQRCQDLEGQNSTLKQSLEEIKAKLLEEEEKTQALTSADEEKQTQIEDLTERLTASQDNVQSVEAAAADSERKSFEKSSILQNSLNKDFARFRDELQADCDNKVHRAKQERLQVEKALEERCTDLAAVREKAKQLQLSLKSLETSLERDAKESTKLDELNEMLKAKENELQTLRQTSLSELQETRRRHEEENNSNTESLVAAEAEKKKVEAALDRFKKQAEGALKNETDKSNKEKDSLHRRVADAEAAVKESERRQQKMREDAEETLRKQQEKTRTDLADYQRQLNEAEASKDQVQQQANITLQQQRIASEQERDALQQRALKAEAALQRYTARQTASPTNQNDDGILAEATPMPFEKFLKKMNRADNSVMEVPESQLGFKIYSDRSEGNAANNRRRTNSQDSSGKENDLGQFEVLDENGVSQVTHVSETQLSRNPRSSQKLDRSMEPSSRRTAEPSSSSLSELSQDIPTPVAAVLQLPSSNTLLPARNRALRELNRKIATPVRVPPFPLASKVGGSQTQSMFGPDNPFVRRNTPNTASRMRHSPGRDAPDHTRVASHHEEEPPQIGGRPSAAAGMPAGHQGSSPPDFMKAEYGSQRMTTYGKSFSRNHPQGHATASQLHSDDHGPTNFLKRSITTVREEVTGTNKRSKVDSSQNGGSNSRAAGRSTGHPQTPMTHTQQSSQLNRAPQSSSKPPRGITSTSSQSRMRTSSSRAPTGGKHAQRRTSDRNDRYDLRFAQELHK
ncbi:hypothetical protein K402DRAFT_425978 [Aulographum hederae CBS 113979]|uniref:Uncharacterized protein n=1 Tax=Aulographum hederae CBS 113979 TaxID=1176131 RepID=A0A6G1GIP8_9PEZI|nr:hypothetical protein K402DRAFT_425978 [Aulographum hederae CBS 113979]